MSPAAGPPPPTPDAPTRPRLVALPGGVTGPRAATPAATAALGTSTAPRRIHITGGPGTGKTTLARNLGATLELPVHALDEVARVGGGTGRVRTPAERAPLVAAIVERDAWVTEGVHLGWTEPLLARAELIVWLEAATGTAAAGHIAERFARGAWAEWRRRTWRERVAAVPGSVRHARDLAGAMIDARRYDRADASDPVDPDGTLDSRAATAAALAPYAHRLVHCRSRADADRLVGRMEALARC